MQFSDNLHEIAMAFKKKYLNHNYLCAHLRRRDFLYGHPSDVPSIKETAKQIIEKLSLLNEIKTIYVATDAPDIGNQFVFNIYLVKFVFTYLIIIIVCILEFEELSIHLKPYQVYKFEADEKTLNTYMDGGVAIIDQIICSQAK